MIGTELGDSFAIWVRATGFSSLRWPRLAASSPAGGVETTGPRVDQSANMNSDVLKMTRQTLAIPFFLANGTSFLISIAVGRRFKAS
jgi:hypothetical protein